MPISDRSSRDHNSVVLTVDLPVVLNALGGDNVLLQRSESGALTLADRRPGGTGSPSEAPDLLAPGNLATLGHACSVAERTTDRVTFAVEHVAAGQTRVLECAVVPVYDRPGSAECAFWVCSYRDVAADYFRLVLEQRTLPGIAGDLAHALENAGGTENVLKLWWNPVHDLRTGRIVNGVASYRWKHPRLGHLVPSAVVEVAHNAGLHPELNAWLLEEVCHAAVAWPASAPHGEIGATISLTPHGLHCASFVRSVMHALSASGLASHRLTIDVDASLLAADDGVLPAVLAHVQALGVRLGVDNFGRSIASFQRTIEGAGLRTVRIASGLTSGVASRPGRRDALSTIVNSLRGSDCQLAAQTPGSTDDQAVLRDLGFDLCAGTADGQRYDSRAFAAWLAEASQPPLHAPT